MTPIKGLGLGLNRECDPGRRDRDAVDIAATAVCERVTQLPTFRAEDGKSVAHLVF